MYRIILILLVLVPFDNGEGHSQTPDPFELYVEKTDEWYPSIFQLYIKQYAGIRVNRYLIDPHDIESIKFALSQFKHKETDDFDEAITAVAYDKKVFFFIGTYAWGGLEKGTVFSGSWQRQMPLCSGFYLSQKKCFQNQGINYHCGKKDKARKVTFFIME